MLRQACLTNGFFYVSNHGIPESVIDGLFATDENAISTCRGISGWRIAWMRNIGADSCPGNQPASGFAADLKESYEIGVDLPETDPDVAAGLPLHGPTSGAADCPWLRTASEAYFGAGSGPGPAAAEGMRSEPRHCRRITSCSTAPSRWCRCGCSTYPPQPPVSRREGFGVAPHHRLRHDHAAPAGSIGGSELKKSRREWVSAPFVPGTLVVQPGDLFQQLDQRRLRLQPASRHQPHRQGRYSVPMFFNLDLQRDGILCSDLPVAKQFRRNYGRSSRATIC